MPGHRRRNGANAPHDTRHRGGRHLLSMAMVAGAPRRDSRGGDVVDGRAPTTRHPGRAAIGGRSRLGNVRAEPAEEPGDPDRAVAGEACRSARRAGRARRAHQHSQTANEVRRRAGRSSEKKEESARREEGQGRARNSRRTKRRRRGPRPPRAAPRASLPRQNCRRSARVALAPVEIVSPDPSRRWRIVNGAIERSEDGGASWIAVATPAWRINHRRDGAPAPSICWLIGSSGLVMVTTDGLDVRARSAASRGVSISTAVHRHRRAAPPSVHRRQRWRGASAPDDSGRTWRAD